MAVTTGAEDEEEDEEELSWFSAATLSISRSCAQNSSEYPASAREELLVVIPLLEQTGRLAKLPSESSSYSLGILEICSSVHALMSSEVMGRRTDFLVLRDVLEDTEEVACVVDVADVAPAVVVEECTDAGVMCSDATKFSALMIGFPAMIALVCNM
jgi:hypothetical protein